MPSKDSIPMISVAWQRARILGTENLQISPTNLSFLISMPGVLCTIRDCLGFCNAMTWGFNQRGPGGIRKGCQGMYEISRAYLTTYTEWTEWTPPHHYCSQITMGELCAVRSKDGGSTVPFYLTINTTHTTHHIGRTIASNVERFRTSSSSPRQGICLLREFFTHHCLLLATV